MLIFSAYIGYTSGLYFIYIGYNNIDISTVIDIILFHSFVKNIPKNIEDLFKYMCIYCCLCFVEKDVNIIFGSYLYYING